MTNNQRVKWDNTWGKVLTGVLILLILGSIAGLVYSVADPFEEPFTEFYLLDTNGKAENYPDELKVGEESRILVGIVNREHKESSYTLGVMVDGNMNREPVEITLEHGEKWEEEIAFSFNAAGDGQKVEFLLYNLEKDGDAQELHLLIDVK